MSDRDGNKCKSRVQRRVVFLMGPSPVEFLKISMEMVQILRKWMSFSSRR